jgi:hypothetical protein
MSKVKRSIGFAPARYSAGARSLGGRETSPSATLVVAAPVVKRASGRCPAATSGSDLIGADA